MWNIYSGEALKAASASAHAGVFVSVSATAGAGAGASFQPCVVRPRIAELVTEQAATTHLMNAVALLPLGVRQGTGVSGADLALNSTKRIPTFTTRRGQRVTAGPG